MTYIAHGCNFITKYKTHISNIITKKIKEIDDANTNTNHSC